MWEFTLMCKKNSVNAVIYIFNDIKSKIKNDNSIITIDEDDFFIYLLFATKNENKSEYKTLIKNSIIDYIINEYKFDYLKKNVSCNLPNQDLFYISYLKLLTLYDKKTDQKALFEAININNVFALDSFIDFRLQILREHWKELCLLTIENNIAIVNKDVLLDIMRFLVNTIDEECEKVKILCKDNSYAVYGQDEKFNKLNKLSVAHTKRDLIFSVLKNPPKYIEIYLMDSENDSGASFLKDLYASRVKIFCQNDKKY